MSLKMKIAKLEKDVRNKRLSLRSFFSIEHPDGTIEVPRLKSRYPSVEAFKQAIGYRDGDTLISVGRWRE
jgi:hypothetical protein